ncbi:type II toxin-antitoxin system RelE/ParE family toxin [Listeria grandensis]|uniref:Type II toxin-antitoxin system RelE/ParE family toxin n=1 Tax=Listeria grandensis TaxID=1494963 RepID=A0A7X0Y2M7_9LIST|nr:type II toxin-antitoxin system RelE/ParE family toxin [Listeria grandensis]MBC1935896.1 type II toxin-antitoxin system RelE/ParE family toxin [Listeria grandensis]
MTETVKIRFSKHASLDYDRISLYLVEDLCQFQAAQKFSQGIELLLLNLASFPMLGKLYDNGKLISKPYRRASFDRYTVFYLYHEDRQLIEVYRILSGVADHSILIKDVGEMYEI